MTIRDLQRSSRNRAFTLIEMLVVVAIIALLMAILMPSLGRARSLARISACASNQRQIGLAINMYASENGDLVVPAIYENRPSTKNPGSAWSAYWWTSLAMGGYTPMTTYATDSDMNALAGTKNSIFRCPDGLPDQKVSTAAAAPSSFTDAAGKDFLKNRYDYQNYTCWYGMNSITYAADPLAYFSRRAQQSPLSSINKLSQFNNPGNLVAVYDGYIIQEYSYDVYPKYMFNVNARHLDTKTVTLFADGHAEAITTAELVPSILVFSDPMQGKYKWTFSR